MSGLQPLVFVRVEVHPGQDTRHDAADDEANVGREPLMVLQRMQAARERRKAIARSKILALLRRCGEGEANGSAARFEQINIGFLAALSHRRSQVKGASV